jgi:hypothetical protein
MAHLPVPGDHSRCHDGISDCRVTGGYCCGGRDPGVCAACDEDAQLGDVEERASEESNEQELTYGD